MMGHRGEEDNSSMALLVQRVQNGESSGMEELY
jgi:hypothetical protein